MMFKSSVQHETDSFYKAVSDSNLKIGEVAKGALTQIHTKLNPRIFEGLSEVVSEFFVKMRNIMFGMLT